MKSKISGLIPNKIPLSGDIDLLKQVIAKHYCQKHNSLLSITAHPKVPAKYAVYCLRGKHFPTMHQITLGTPPLHIVVCKVDERGGVK